MIQNIRHRGLKRLYEGASRKGVSAEIAPKLERILARLDIAASPDMMRLPGYRLHPLGGELKEFWSIWVTGNWRVIFRFEGSHVSDVDLVDYH